MQRRTNLTPLILAIVAVLGLTPPMVGAVPQAQIVFSSHRDGNWEIYVMDTDGKNQRRLTNNDFDEWEPSWSPDGKHIAFTASEDRVVDQHPQIYVMDADGGNLRKLTKNPFPEWDPSWSPDGKRIAFTADVNWHTNIYEIDADGQNLRRLGQDEQMGKDPSWSPDGKHIAFVSIRGKDGWDNDIYVMDADGKNQRRLTNNDFDEWDPSWSPDGERIVFSSVRDGHVDANGWLTAEIYVMDADGRNLRRLTNNDFDDRYPSWSPDSERIVFASEGFGNFDIYVMNADGARQVRRRTKNRSGDADPAWFDPAFAVEVAPFAVGPARRKLMMWGWLKQGDQ